MRPWVVTVATVVMLSLTALAAPASATWTATCDTLANTVTFSGSGGLVLSDSGGSLAHDQAGTFIGPTDCDSSTPGTQTVSTPASITVSGTGSPASLDVDWTASSADVSSYVSPGGVSGTPLGNVAASGL